MTAKQSIERALKRAQLEQMECVSEDGYVLNNCKYKYQELTKEIKKLHDALEFMQKGIN